MFKVGRLLSAIAHVLQGIPAHRGAEHPAVSLRCEFENYGSTTLSFLSVSLSLSLFMSRLLYPFVADPHILGPSWGGDYLGILKALDLHSCSQSSRNVCVLQTTRQEWCLSKPYASIHVSKQRLIFHTSQTARDWSLDTISSKTVSPKVPSFATPSKPPNPDSKPDMDPSKISIAPRLGPMQVSRQQLLP